MERGEIYRFDFEGMQGSEALGSKHAVIVQTGWVGGINTYLAVPCTDKLQRRRQATCVFVPKEDSNAGVDLVAVCHLLSALDDSQIVEAAPAGRVTRKTLQKILLVLDELLGITEETRFTDPPSP